MCVQPLPVTNRIYSCWTDNLMKPYPLGISWGMAKQEGRSWEGEGGGGSPIKRSPFDSEGEKKTAFASRVLTHCIRRTTFTFGPFFVNPHWILVAAAAWSQNDPWNNLRIIFAGEGVEEAPYTVLLARLLEYCLLHPPPPPPVLTTHLRWGLGQCQCGLVNNLQTIETISHFRSKVPHWQTCLLFTTWKIPKILFQFHKLCFAFQ